MMMNKGQEKRPFIRLLITTVLGILLLITIVPRAKCVYELSHRKANLEAEKESLIQQNAQLEKAMQGHILAQAELVGLYKRKAR